MVTDPRIDEIAAGVYRISTPTPTFTFNQYLVVDDEPLLFHTGMRSLFSGVRRAIASVMPIDRLAWVSFGHFEPDECGALGDFLAAAPAARPLCGKLQAMLTIGELTDRAPLVLADGEAHTLGSRTVRWIDAPHVPHGWDNGFLFEERDRTLFCGDLFTQGGSDHAPLTERDILGPSEATRARIDYYAHAPHTGAVLERLAGLAPATLCCMHGSAFRGDGATLLRGLAAAL